MDKKEKKKLNKKFYLESNAYYKYESDATVDFNIYLRNLPDSVYRKYFDDFQWSVENLPLGAQFNKNTKTFKWDKQYVKIGIYSIKFKLISPYQVDTLTVKFEVQEEWKTSFIPGVSFTSYYPKDSDFFGVFNGFSIEYLLYAGIHRNDNRGPSHTKFYIKFDLLSSSKKDVSEALNYSIGLNLSVERNPVRKYLIPFFGLDIGILYHKNIDNIFTFTPLAGVWLYADQNIFAHITAGYLYPAQSLETLRGLRLLGGIDFSLW